MTTPEARFDTELEIFRTEAQAATQFFYAYIGVHMVARAHKSVHRMLNDAPVFWNTILGGLQAATFVALGRIFDQKSSHNLDQLLRMAQRDRQIFSKASLGKRKQAESKNAYAWLNGYLLRAHEPTARDFRRLRSHVRKWRKVYEKNYQPLRHQVYAHKELAERQAISSLFAKTNIRELQRLLVFLGSLYQAMWELFNNGRKPVLRPQRYSIRRMRALPSPPGRRRNVQELIALESERFLKAASEAYVGHRRNLRPIV